MQDSYTHTPRRRTWHFAAFLILALFACVAPGCGGGAGGEAAGRGLALLNFSLDGVDNAVLNQVLLFNFSGSVDPATISPASIQIREGPAFGASVEGIYVVTGSTVRFEPRLPTLCDLSDSAFKPDTQYRVQVIGFPEQFAVRNSAGQSLSNTSTHEFHTRDEDDPTKYADQIPGVGPSILSTTPDNGSEAVTVAAGNKVEIVLSENLNPCSVNDSTVRFHLYETGDPILGNAVAAPNTNASGFYAGGDTSDQAPLDHTTWGADVSTPWAPAQRILANIELIQSFAETRIVVTPRAGFNPDPAKSAPVFPENALLVVELTSGITDFGNQPLVPKSFSFTTQNLDTLSGQYLLENEGETPYLDSGTTADVDTPRAPGRVQGFMLFSGDADNGDFQEMPSGPNSVASGCTVPLQANNGVKDEFDPPDGFLLDTGSTPNTCVNSTDGSTAVVWEFLTFTIRSGVTVRVVGANPAIILVTGDVNIDSGGRLLVRGDGNGGTPDGQGRRGRDRSNGGADNVNPGGVGVAGGGNGGNATKVENNNQNWKYGNDGNAGFGSDDYDPLMVQVLPLDDNSTEEPLGGGQGGAPAGVATSSPWDGGSEAGGGGGHSEAGTDGQYSHGTPTNWVLKLARRAKGGRVYGDDNDPMFAPFAGSGGGAAGHAKDQPWRSSTSEGVGGGSGGAGGGFVDLTASGDIIIAGTIDAAGSRGGNGRGWRTEANPDRGVSGGGGGGSGGGIRLLTPRDILLGATSVITAAGGAGGTGSKPFSVNTRSNGGVGASGRIAMEDSDSIIAGMASAGLTPNEGDPGFYRGIFDATRFQGGGLTPAALTDVFAVGPFNPDFIVPVQADFLAALPTAGAPGAGNTGILIEMRGYQMSPTAEPDPISETDWFSIGYFKDTGIESLPEWNTGQPGDIPRALDNTGDGIDLLDGFEFIQIRVTIFLPSTISVTDPGGLLDDWTIRYVSNQ